MHLTTQKLMFCPFSNCVRASGTGFTRRENLEEHKRSRHPEMKPQSLWTDQRQITPKPITEDYHESDEVEKNDTRENRKPDTVLKCVFAQLAQKDETIRKQAIEIGRLSEKIVPEAIITSSRGLRPNGKSNGIPLP